jgi:hypothetical protein
MRILQRNRGFTGSAPCFNLRPEFAGEADHLDAPNEVPLGATRNLTPEWTDVAIVTSEVFRPGVFNYE